MKRRKPKSDRKERYIMVRATDDHKALLISAAREVGLDLSNWVRTLALREAKKVISEARSDTALKAR